MKKFLALIVCVLFFSKLYSQIGGLNTFDFLNLTSSPKVAALGGKFVSGADEDLSVTYHNPSLLNQSMDHQVSLNYVNYYAGINYGYVATARNLTQLDNISVGIQYINYGSFTSADEFGNQTGTFSAGDYALNLVFSHKLNNYITLGGDFRGIFSSYANYSSSGISTDWGILYNNFEKLFSFALVVRNLGTQITAYVPGEYERLPLEFQAGITKKLKYAPFRFSITAQNLNTPDLTISNALVNSISTNSTTTNNSDFSKITDDVFRHLIFGVEILPFKGLSLRAGYNYERRQDLGITANLSAVGWSWGFSLDVSRFKIGFAWSDYSLSGMSEFISISTELKGKNGRKHAGDLQDKINP